VLRAFFDRICRGKPERRKKAIVATGRKLLTIMFAMLRDNAAFAPGRMRPSAAALISTVVSPSLRAKGPPPVEINADCLTRRAAATP
jgi:hypothetical protein